MKRLVQQIRNSKWFKVSTNKFVIATAGFIVWMLFLDVNSVLIHWELNQEKEELEQSIRYYKTELDKDKKQLKELTSNPEMLEKFAREQYWMKKPGEEIFLVEAE